MASWLALLAALIILLLCFPFSGNSSTSQSQPYNDYPTAPAPTTWNNSPSSIRHSVTFDNRDNSTARALLLRLNSQYFGPSFALGFYCFSPCNSFFLSVFIVYADSGGRMMLSFAPQVVWSANRARPVGENATLELTFQNGLTLRDGDGSLVWTTDVANGSSVVGMNITRSGNLVLFDNIGSILWQSFDHPTDCLVIGQSLAGGMRLIANSSSNDLAESELYVTLLAGGLFAFAGSDPPQMYYPNSVDPPQNRTLDKSVHLTFMNGSLTMSSTLSSYNKAKKLFDLPLANSIQYLRLESDGHLRLYEIVNDTIWMMVNDLFQTDLGTCDYPTVCGKYGICNNGQCTCPETYFKLVDDRQADSGCIAATALTCSHLDRHQLIDFNDLSYFNYDDVFFNETDKEGCENACLENCSCKAALFRSYGALSYGYCLTLTEPFSFENHNAEEKHYNSTAYIKVQIAPSPLSNNKSASSGVGLAAILGSTIGALIFLLTLVGIYVQCRRRGEEAEDEDYIKQLPGLPTRFTFEELRVATEGFTEKLGEGGFGTVFQGKWHDEKIAVKRLDNVGHGKRDFLAEVETIGSIYHINLVRLVGFCADKLNRLLVYEYVSNGSLDRWICCRDGRLPLDWSIRFKIITDIAKGLCYLHEECRQRIVHFDIKPENILLDEEFNAKVSDFGLSKLIDRDISKVMTRMKGTPGYLAPEWLTAMVTEKVDVYSFGVVVTEILCGRRNLDYSQTEESDQHLIKLLEEKCKSNQFLDLIDKKLGDVELYKKDIDNVMKLAMWCLQWDSTRRPSMLVVVKVLEGAMEVETSLDYNFVSSNITILNESGLASQSAPLLTSTSLSGPR